MLVSLESKRLLQSSFFFDISIFSDELETICLSDDRLFTVGEQNQGEESWHRLADKHSLTNNCSEVSLGKQLGGAAFVPEGLQQAM